MIAARNRTAGYTLVELLIVVALVGILATAVLPWFNPAVSDGLTATAQILSADLANARGLAVTNNSQYRLTFDTSQNRYVLSHSGTNTLLQALPFSPFRRSDDPPDRQTTDFDDIPHTGPTVELFAALTSSVLPQSVADVEFAPLGGTTRATGTVIWLASGAGDNRRYLSVSIDPITGLASIGDLQTTAPVISSGSLAPPAGNGTSGGATLPTLPTGT